LELGTEFKELVDILQFAKGWSPAEVFQMLVAWNNAMWGESVFYVING
jgi:hypothetical protein